MPNYEKELRRIFGNKQMDAYVAYAYEYARREASYLQFKAEAKSELEYKVVFVDLVELRRKMSMEELYECASGLAEEQGVTVEELAGNFDLEIFDYTHIEGDIHRRYNPPEVEQ